MVIRFSLALVFAILSTLALMMATSFDNVAMPIISAIYSGIYDRMDFINLDHLWLFFTFLSLVITSSIQAIYALSLTALAKIRGASSSLVWFPLCGNISVWVLDRAYSLGIYRLGGPLGPIVMIATFVIIIASLIQSLRKTKQST
jgi:hypothetical protein